MTRPRYPRGAEWRRWDIHIHSPATLFNNNFDGATEAEKWEQYLRKLESFPEIVVLGVTDYFSIDGYLRLKTFKDAGRIPNVALLLPNVELRLLPVTAAERPINLHFIFSPEIVEHLESTFFQALEFPLDGNSYRCTRADLLRLGRAFKREPALEEAAAYKEGVGQFKVTREALLKVLNANADLKANCVIAVANSNQDGNSGIQEGHMVATREEIYRMAHIVFSGNPRDVEYFLGRGVDTPDIVKQKYGSVKPCLIGSDAHNNQEIGQPGSDRHTWIKADPTFAGLRQILVEPADRVFVGPMPPALRRIETNPTRIVRSVRLRKREESERKLDEKWFSNTDVPLNSELVAIIGNKGSGKSALADVMGLLGNTTRHEAFGFLNTTRFRDSKNNKAKHFEAVMTWADTTEEGPRPLDENPEPESIEKVKYIPQSYLETICNDVVLGKASPFYAELEQVIFSHVPEHEKLGFSTLTGLLEHKSKETNETIGQLVAELWEICGEIVTIEEALSPKHVKSLEAQLAERQRVLEAHILAKPKDRPKPDEVPGTQQQTNEIAAQIDKDNAELKDIQQQIKNKSAERATLAVKLAKAEKLLAKIKNIHRQIDSFTSESAQDFTDLGISPQAVLSVTVSLQPVEELIAATAAQMRAVEAAIEGDSPESLENKQAAFADRIKLAQSKLDAPSREYQAYLDELKTWQETQDGIVGDESASGSIKHFQKQIEDVKALPNELKRMNRERNHKTLEIYREKKRLQAYYETYYGEVQRFLERHPLSVSGQFKLTFDVSITESKFAEEFLSRINQRKASAFSGVEEGAARLKQLLADTNFDSALGTMHFIKKLVKMLTNDGKGVDLKDRLKMGSVQDLYSQIFGLRYLSPIYNLRWDGKGLERLSPGERGNLLLIFFLLIDIDDKPLVIDQPEENLDNQTIVRTLVPCIKDAKKRRQLVLVTHNPNLAVVCDAEQVIYSQITKGDKNEVIYVSGSIEDPVINRKIIDVLEGTRPAFDKRDEKYTS